MKRLTLFALLAGILAIALPIFAVPGNFDFAANGNPIPDQATVTEDVLFAAIGLDGSLDFEVNQATDTVSYTWYIWGPGGDVGNTAAAAYSVTAADSGNATTIISVSGDDLNAVANIISTVGEGLYSWTIEANDSNMATTGIDSGILEFTIQFWGLNPGDVDYVAPMNGELFQTDQLSLDLNIVYEDFSGLASYEDYEDVEFRIWAGDDPADTTGTPLATVLASADGETGDLAVDVPAATVETLPEGDYIWAIYLVDTQGTEADVIMIENFYTFRISEFDVLFDDPGHTAPMNGAQIANNMIPANITIVTGPLPAGYENAEFRLWSPGSDPQNDAPDLVVPDAEALGTPDGVIGPIDTSELTNGTYTWTVVATDTIDPDIEATGLPYTFSITSPSASAIYPAPGATLTIPLESIVFNGEAGADWYNIRIRNSADSSVAFEGWVAASVGSNASNACTADGGVCAVFPNTGVISGVDVKYVGGPVIFSAVTGQATTFPTLVNGEYLIDFQTYDLETATLGERVGESAFSIAATAIADDETVITTPFDVAVPREVSWLDNPNALFYSVEVTNAADQSLAFRPTTGFGAGYEYSASYCQGGECTVALPALPDGIYDVTVYAWGPANELVVAETGETFTISRTTPEPIELVSPMNNTVIGTNIVELTFGDSVNYTWLRVQIVNPTANIVTSEWVEAGEICNGFTCTYEVFLPDANGYNVWISGWNLENGFGEAGATTFDISPE